MASQKKPAKATATHEWAQDGAGAVCVRCGTKLRVSPREGRGRVLRFVIPGNLRDSGLAQIVPDEAPPCVGAA